MKKQGITLIIFPFDNLSEKETHALFCRSFSIDLLTELSRFRQFHIISYESVKDAILSSADNSYVQDFRIDYIIKGIVRNADDNLFINAQLINAKNNQLIWAERFEGNINSIFSIQEELLREIVSALEHQLNCDLLAQVQKKPPVELRTYECWLHGMEELKKGSLASDIRARTYFQQAIEHDPGFSLAYSGMSLTYFNEWSCQLWERWDVSRNGAYDI